MEQQRHWVSSQSLQNSSKLKLHTSSGIGPTKEFASTYNNCKFSSCDNSMGTVPVKEFSKTDRPANCSKRPSVVGMVPVIAFAPKSNSSRSDSRPSWLGMVASRSFAYKTSRSGQREKSVCEFHLFDKVDSVSGRSYLKLTQSGHSSHFGWNTTREKIIFKVHVFYETRR